MEFTTVSESIRDESAAKNRFESFKLGKGLPSTLAMSHPRHSHTRSHSRNASVSSVSSTSLSTSKSTSANDLSSFSFPQNGISLSSSTSSPTPGPPSKRNSHHRRRSSVSTRHESAEMMGVTVPDLPPSTSEDNINLGEKDSIRRRALWALEGKPDVSFAKVEIPELASPDIEKLALDFPTKLSFSTSSSTSYNNGLNSLMGNKRDSFKLLAASASSKDQLHTLVEEEEEEECEVIPPERSLPSPASSEKDLSQEVPILTPIAPLVTVVKPTPTRPRPANLNLRPLSLTPDNLVTTNPGLPTPSLTPSPRAGLKSLALAQITNLDEAQVKFASQSRRSATISPTPFSRRPSLSVDTCDSPTPMSAIEDKPARRSSISYKRSSHGTTISLAGLPTPEMTPTFNRRYSLSGSNASISSAPDGFFPDPPTQTRPLSTSEQHFLFKSHNALLARITDLERALSMRRTSSGGYSNSGSSRPVSVASNFSSSSDMGSNGEPSDEMLRLIADLKAERDELKRDVDGWRMRVGDMDKQVIVLTKRVDVERREAWVARSRVGLLEVEKNTLERKVVGVEEKLVVVESENSVLRSEKAELEEQTGVMKERVVQLEAELEKIILELDEERELRRQREEADLDLLTTPTPESQTRSVFGYSKRRGLGFTSVDSESSATDVEVDLSEDAHNFGFPLKVVEEETEENDEDDTMSDDDNGLAGYEDEEESDISFRSSSSFDSMDDFPRSTAQFCLDVPTTPTSPTSPISECSTTVGSRPATPEIIPTMFASAPSAPAVHTGATHVSRRSLSKPWTFPRGVQASIPSAEQAQDDGVDRFFGCLEDLDDHENNANSAPGSPSAYTYEKSKSLFASGFKYASDDDDMPFFLLNNTGSAISDERLPVVEEASEEEEREDDSDMFGMIGGIKITFTPAEEDDEEDNSESEVQFSPVKKDDMPPVLPVFDFDEDVKQEEEKEKEEAVPFNFGRPIDEEKPTPIVPATMITPPSSIPRPKSPSTFYTLPSSIPRPNSRPSFSSFDIVASTPPKAPAPQPVLPINYASSAYVTPPTKRGGMSPSFIPQPSPSPLRKVSAGPKASTSTFIRQPQRKPLMSTNNNRNLNGIANGSKSMPQPVTIQNSPMNPRFSLRRSADDPPATFNSQISPSEMKTLQLSHDTFHTPPRTHDRPENTRQATTTPSFSSLMSAPIASRLSLQSFTSFIPLSWSGRSTSTKTAVSAAASLCLVPSSTSASLASTEASIEEPMIQVPSKRGYVSREKQLDKLRCRLEKEGFMPNAINVSCKKCENTLVVF